jgi:integrase
MGVKTAEAKTAAEAGGEEHKRKTVDEVGREALERLKKGHASSSHMSSARKVISILKYDVIPPIRYADELGDEDLDERFRAALETKEYAEPTVKNLNYELSRIRKLAAGERVSFMKVSRRLRVLSMPASVVERLLKHLHARAKDGDWADHRLYAVVATIVFSGIKTKYVLNLRVKDIDLAKGAIHVWRSHRRALTFPLSVPIPDELHPVFADWLPRLGDNEWLFPGTSFAGPWDDSGADIAVRKAAALIGIQKHEVSFGALRNFHDDIEAFRRLRKEDVEALVRFHGDLGAEELSTAIPQCQDGPPASTWKSRRLARALLLKEAISLVNWLRVRAGDWDWHRLYAYVGILTFSGINRKKIKDIKWNHVNIEKEVIDIPGSDPLRLTPESAEILKGWRDRPDRPESAWVFPGERSKGAWDRTIVAYELDIACRGAGIKEINPGDLWRFGEVPENRRALAAWWRGVDALESHPAAPAEPGKVRSRPSERMLWYPGSPAIYVRPSDRMAFVFGVEKGGISNAQARVINMLRRAGPEGLTLAEMKAKLGTGSGRVILSRLKKIDADWGAAILTAGRSHEGYRLASAR